MAKKYSDFVKDDDRELDTDEYLGKKDEKAKHQKKRSGKPNKRGKWEKTKKAWY
jgi:hypothetical protein